MSFVDFPNAAEVSAAYTRTLAVGSELASAEAALSIESARNFFEQRLVPIFKFIRPDLQFRFDFFDHRAASDRLHEELAIVSFERGKLSTVLPLTWLEKKNSGRTRGLLARAIVCPLLIPRDLEGETFSFIFELGDTGYLPAVSFCSKNNFALLVPDFAFLCSDGYQQLRETWSAEPAWDERTPKVFWRGSTTGLRRFDPPPEGQGDDFRWLPRLWLCALSKHTPIADYMDVGVSNIAQISEEHVRERIKRADFLKEPVPKASFNRYKYMFDIDGNSNAWEGLYTALLSGACVLKIGSSANFRQWYYDSLVAFSNFVPINNDFTDFSDAVRWAVTHDHEAKDIGSKGRKLALSITFESELIRTQSKFNAWLGSGSQSLLAMRN